MRQVNPSWQRSGLGRAAVERLISSLAEEDISTITLYAEPKVVGLYERLGFQKDPAGIKVRLESGSTGHAIAGDALSYSAQMLMLWRGVI